MAKEKEKEEKPFVGGSAIMRQRQKPRQKIWDKKHKK